MASSPIILWEMRGKSGNQWQILFSWAPNPLWTVTAAMKFKGAPWKENYDKPRQHVKKQRYHFANKGPSSQNYGFSSSHVQCESWTIKRARPRRLDAFELWCWRTPESPLGSREIQPVSPKENQPWIFIGRTDAEAPVLGYLMWRADSLEKTLMLGKIEGRRRRGWDRKWNSWIASPTQWTRVWANFKDFLMDRDCDGQEAQCAAVHGAAKIWTGLNDWTATKAYVAISLPLRTALMHSTDFGELCFYFHSFWGAFYLWLLHGLFFFFSSMSVSLHMFFTHFLPAIEY